MTAQGDATRRRLLEATTTVVREVGYARATTKAIADTAGLAEGTIYRHFPDKRELFFAAILSSHTATVDWMSSLPGRAGQSTVRDNLLLTLRQLAVLRADAVPLELSLMADPELAGRHRDLTSSHPSQDQGLRGLLRDYLVAERDLGRIRSDVAVDSVTVVILATLFGLALLPSGDDPVSPQMIAAAVDLFAAALEAGPSASGQPPSREQPTQARSH